MLFRFAAALFLAVLSIAPGLANAEADIRKSANRPSGAQVIQHVIILMQENRTPDNLFHGLPNADIADYGINSKGHKIELGPVALANTYDMDHYHADFVRMYDGGKMDGADLIPADCGKHCPPNMQFKYVQSNDVGPYFQLAEQYAFGDRMFQSNQGASFAAHQFIIASTSAPAPNSELLATDNMYGVPNANKSAGCSALQDEYSPLIDPSGRESLISYPCFEHVTMMDLLDDHGLSWRYYTPGRKFIWTGPVAIHHLYYGKDWNYIIQDPNQVLTDIADGNLANVAWVMPTWLSSDHPHGNDGSGPSWIASVVNAVGNSDYWSNTAIFVTWDDWGGWYDHVPPSIRNSYEYGFRVPLLVVSSYAKSGYVSHQTHDFSSILKFIETAFNLPSLGFGDQYSDDLTDCFNFNQKPLIFHTIRAPLDANHFLREKYEPPLVDPDDD